MISEDQLNLPSESARKESPEEEFSPRRQSLNDAVKAFERRMIEDAIRRCNGNKQKAAEFLA